MDYSTSLLAVNITINTVIINSTIINIAVPDSNWNDSIYGISCQVVFWGFADILCLTDAEFSSVQLILLHDRARSRYVSPRSGA